MLYFHDSKLDISISSAQKLDAQYTDSQITNNKFHSTHPNISTGAWIAEHSVQLPGYGLGNQGISLIQGDEKEIFLFSKSFRLTTKSIKPPIQCIPGFVSLWVK